MKVKFLPLLALLLSVNLKPAQHLNHQSTIAGRNPQEVLDKALLTAVQSNNVDRVRQLLQQGANVNFLDRYKEAPLFYAVKSVSVDVVPVLLAAGAQVNNKNDGGTTALMEAAKNGHPDILSELLAAQANVNDENQEGNTALIFAVKYGHEVAVSELIHVGADVNHKNYYKETALILAAKNGHKYVVSMLLDAGAQINDVDRLRFTAVEYAVHNEHGKVVGLLLDKGARVPEEENIKYYMLDTNHSVLAHMGLNLVKLDDFSFEKHLQDVRKELKVSDDESIEKSPHQQEIIQLEQSWKKDFKEQFDLYTKNQPNTLADFVFNTSPYAAKANFTYQVMDALRRPVYMCEPLLNDLAKTPEHKTIAQKMMNKMRRQTTPKGYKKPVSKTEDID